jgi:predicted negative regulator of RcsB-dependent stress response
VSDYLTDEEQLDKLKKWWEQNGLVLAVAVTVAVVGVVGWNWYGDHTAEQTARSSDLYVDYLASEGQEREMVAATLASEFPDSTYHVMVMLRNAERKMSEEDVEAAELLLGQAVEVAGDDKLKDVARLRLARVQQQLDRSEAALTTLSQVKSIGMRSQVQELKGDIHMIRGERAAAHEAYSAALGEAGEGAQRPLLEMKVADTADTNDA